MGNRVELFSFAKTDAIWNQWEMRYSGCQGFPQIIAGARSGMLTLCRHDVSIIQTLDIVRIRKWNTAKDNGNYPCDRPKKEKCILGRHLRVLN